jgi:hypothetical protein
MPRARGILCLVANNEDLPRRENGGNNDNSNGNDKIHRGGAEGAEDNHGNDKDKIHCGDKETMRAFEWFRHRLPEWLTPERDVPGLRRQDSSGLEGGVYA